MKNHRLALLLFGISIGVAARNGAAQANAQPAADTAPAPAFGQSAPVLSPDNPPITGLDEPGLGLRSVTSSFVSPALQFSQSADTNGSNQLGQSGLQGVTRALGALDLQQFWPKSDLLLEYLGGGEFYNSPFSAVQLQALGLEGVTRWRTGQATLRDTFSYMPDGAFAIGYGGVPGLGIASTSFGIGLPGGGLAGLNNPNGQVAPVGDVPRLANTAILDLVQATSPVSALTAAVGYSNAHYFDAATCAATPLNCLDNSDELTVQGGYSHLINRQDQLGLVYAFQIFQFPQITGGTLYLHIVNLRYSHNITGRLSLVLGAGPQYTQIEQNGYASRWTPSARVTLRYKFAHSSLSATYEKYTSSGAGVFTGANDQSIWVAYSQPVGRTWQVYGDLGFSHNAQIQGGSSSYNNGAAGVDVRKHVGRAYDVFGAYRYTEVGFGSGIPASVDIGTGTTARRNIVTVGLEWHPQPTRIE
jgi:hypothetical protein